MDPLFKSFPWYTPYQFAGNKPIFAIDLDGAEELPYFNRYDYEGNEVDDYLKAGYNGLVEIANILPRTWNALYHVGRDIYHGTTVENATNDLATTANSIEAGVEYLVNTPLSDLNNAANKFIKSPEAVEFGVGVFVGSRIPLRQSAIKKVTKNFTSTTRQILNPNQINFSQRTVSGNVKQYIIDMKNGNWDWDKSGPIRIMEMEGKWVSYDNRRLLAAQKAGLDDIPYQIVKPDDIMPGSKKTWAEAFEKRFKDQRNVEAGGVVPKEGLSTQPIVVE